MLHFRIAVVDAQSGTLADALNTIANGVNWANTDWHIQHTGLIFGKVTTPNYRGFDNAWTIVDQGRALRMAEIDGFTWDKTAYLSSQDMISYLPHTLDYNGGEYYLVYHRFLENAYRWAQGTAYASKWSKSGAIADMRSLLGNGPIYDGVKIAYSPPRTGYDVYLRYYDSTSETIQFIAAGLGDLEFAKAIWNWAQSAFWKGSYYSYKTDGGIECEAGPFAFNAGQLYVLSGGSSGYIDRVTADLEYKFLTQEWGSPLWAGSFVCTHACDNRLRLQNSLSAWAAIQAYYSKLSVTGKQNMVSMLNGAADGEKAWVHLLESPLYDAASKKFRLMTNDSAGAAVLRDEWTVMGLKLMLLMGIVPVSGGGLAVPLLDESYEETESIMPATHFKFDYSGHSVTIPVQTGAVLAFQFGSQTTNGVSFSSSGIYRITFSNDWNTVSSSVKVSELNPSFPYFDSSYVPPSQQDYGSIQMTSNVAVSTYYANSTWTSPTVQNVQSQTWSSVLVGAYTVFASSSSETKSIAVTVQKDLASPAPFTFTTPPPGAEALDLRGQWYEQSDLWFTVIISNASWTSENVTVPIHRLFPLSSGSYSVKGSYQVNASYESNIEESIMVASGQTTYVTLNFTKGENDGGGGGSWNFPLVAVAVAVIGGGGGIVVVAIQWRRSRSISHVQVPKKRRKHS